MTGNTIGHLLPNGNAFPIESTRDVATRALPSKPYTTTIECHSSRGWGDGYRPLQVRASYEGLAGDQTNKGTAIEVKGSRPIPDHRQDGIEWTLENNGWHRMVTDQSLINALAQTIAEIQGSISRYWFTDARYTGGPGHHSITYRDKSAPKFPFLQVCHFLSF